ncbi:hypothetical protein L6164_014980 [Bauhinia variegata]|uniref:Uncharacterized protein n=1 Tax=Bauhinia variegata TaxID=167791 RepID=A0ACB9NNY7_BAUVA|nr:hypothetical protein L6164_014980 [Bauhinia variegata]
MKYTKGKSMKIKIVNRCTFLLSPIKRGEGKVHGEGSRGSVRKSIGIPGTTDHYFKKEREANFLSGFMVLFL